MNRDIAQPDNAPLRRRLRAWFNQPLGRVLWDAERAQLDPILANLFGYHLLQVGSMGEDGDLLFASRIAHCVVLDADVTGGDVAAGVWGRSDALPIASDSLDVLVMPHTLEFEADPHQVLREAERVLIPEGHLVIVGFNPYSLWGLWRLVATRQGEVPWSGRFFSQTRVRDWLSLLGFETVLIRQFFFRPPMNRRGLLDNLRFLESLGRRWWPIFCGAYVVVAKKQVVTLTPIRPRWRPKRSLLGGLAEPSARGMRRDR